MSLVANGIHEVLVEGEWVRLPRDISEIRSALLAVDLWDGDAPFYHTVARLERTGLFRRAEETKG